MDEFVEACRERGQKMTHQRIEIFREVIRSDEHPDAETIYERVGKRIRTISRNTVYQTLWFLVDNEFISTLGVQRDRSRFDGNVGRHHHIVCTECGKVGDFEKDEFDSLTPPRSLGTWGELRSTHVEMRGVSAECLPKKGS